MGVFSLCCWLTFDLAFLHRECYRTLWLLWTTRTKLYYLESQFLWSGVELKLVLQQAIGLLPRQEFLAGDSEARGVSDKLPLTWHFYIRSANTLPDLYLFFFQAQPPYQVEKLLVIWSRCCLNQILTLFSECIPKVVNWWLYTTQIDCTSFACTLSGCLLSL